ncbi:hypothetical protein [Schlesneria paludicola]|uniref:hypothetical protein n=1 Tax=Schlesneria paludicola TaxID=360056 RepID=UPI00029AE61C|nr:hypothetical protein [Schlesneria paludicola]
MSTPWLKRIKRTGQLTVHNKATAWSAAVTKGMTTFNGLGFGVKMVPAEDEKSANVVILAANGPQQYPYYGQTLKTKPEFKPDELDGQTSVVTDDRLKETFFACIFLPGRVKSPTKDQQEMVVVHELIHAAGMDEHDSSGIMFSHMQASGTGLLEYLHDASAKPMPPVRLGGMTKCKVQMLWTDSPDDDCKKD